MPRVVAFLPIGESISCAYVRFTRRSIRGAARANALQKLVRTSECSGRERMALAYLEGVASTVMARFERRVRIFTRETTEKTSIRFLLVLLVRFDSVLSLRSYLSEISKGSEESAFPSRAFRVRKFDSGF